MQVPLGYFVRCSELRHRKGWSVDDVTSRMGIDVSTWKKAANATLVTRGVMELFRVWSKGVRLASDGPWVEAVTS